MLLAVDQLYPSSYRLSTQYTRQLSYHLSNISAKFLHLSYQLPGTDTLAPSTTRVASQLTGWTSSALYVKGIDDIFIVAFWVVAFTFIREVVIRFLWFPLAKMGGVTRHSTLARFGEQGWNIVYFSVMWSAGVWIMQHSDYRNLRLAGLWENYPHYKLTWQMKTYYLVHAGFWVQSIIAVNMEKRRKDYYQVGCSSFLRGSHWLISSRRCWHITS